MILLFPSPENGIRLVERLTFSWCVSLLSAQLHDQNRAWVRGHAGQIAGLSRLLRCCSRAISRSNESSCIIHSVNAAHLHNRFYQSRRILHNGGLGLEKSLRSNLNSHRSSAARANVRYPARIRSVLVRSALFGISDFRNHGGVAEELSVVTKLDASTKSSSLNGLMEQKKEIRHYVGSGHRPSVAKVCGECHRRKWTAGSSPLSAGGSWCDV